MQAAVPKVVKPLTTALKTRKRQRLKQAVGLAGAVPLPLPKKPFLRH